MSYLFLSCTEKINDNSKIIAGLNPVPFGLGRFWGNTYYLGIANSAG